MLEGRAGLATVTTTSTRPTQTPVTRRLGGASGACTTRKESTASAAASATTGTPSSRTVGVRCAFHVPAHWEGFHFLLQGGSRSSGISFLWEYTCPLFREVKFLLAKRKMLLIFFFFFFLFFISSFSSRTEVSRYDSVPERDNQKKKLCGWSMPSNKVY